MSQLNIGLRVHPVPFHPSNHHLDFQETYVSTPYISLHVHFTCVQLLFLEQNSLCLRKELVEVLVEIHF